MFDLNPRPAPLLLALLLTLAMTGGCSSKRQTTNPDNVLWFCQSNESGEGWDCVQDELLAQHPVPTRLPPELAPPESEAAEQNAAVQAVAAETAPPTGHDIADLSVDPKEELKRLQAEESAAPPAPPAGPGHTEPPTPPPPVDAATRSAVAQAEAADVPKYIQLAYVPAEPTAILDLPGEYYAVQVLAMNTREQIEKYVSDNGLHGISAARVEKDGDIYYVLVLGVYTTYARAEEAVTDLPPPLATTAPWIRPLSSLQEAIRTADSIAGNSDY